MYPDTIIVTTFSVMTILVVDDTDGRSMLLEEVLDDDAIVFVVCI